MVRARMRESQERRKKKYKKKSKRVPWNKKII